MTTEQKIALKEKIEKLAFENFRPISTWKNRLNDNYLFNFEWVAEKLFKAKWIDDVYERLLNSINESIEQNDDTDFTERIENLKERYRNDLLTRSLMASSSNPLHNLSTLWICECKQELLEVLPTK